MANKHRYNDSKSRQEFWADVCNHISQGYSMKSYAKADEDTIYSYAKKFPEDCPIALLNDAKRESCFFWEKVGIGGATGQIPNFNSTSWIFNMKNRFGWRDSNVAETNPQPIQPIEIIVKDARQNDPAT